MLLVSLAVAALVSGSIGCMGGRIHTDLSQLTESREEASGAMTRERLRREVQRFAHRYFAWLTQTGNEGQRAAATPFDRREWQRYKIYMASTTVSIAAGSDPLTNLLDMMVFTRITAERARKLSVEPSPILSSDRVFSEATAQQFEKLDSEIWAVGARVLEQEQLDALDQLIVVWREENPEVRYVTAARFGEFAFERGEMELWNALSDGVLSGIGLLPDVGDMTRAVDEARDFSERILFYVEHLQFLVRWQGEYVVYETLAQPDVQTLIADTSRLAQSSERIAAVFETLPAQIEQLEQLSAEARRTLEVGGETAIRVNEAASAINALFESDEEEAGDEPFDITEYGSVAVEIAAAAQQLAAMADTLDRILLSNSADVERLGPILRAVSQIEDEGEELADRVFFLGVAFVLIALVACIAAGLLYQAASRAFFGTHRRS
jgi:hypothetical protein